MGTSEASPRALRTTMPARAYVDPSWFALEMDRVFARMWLAAGRADQLDHPGAFIRRDVAGASVLIVRARGWIDSRASQRLPPSRHAALHRAGRHVPRQHPVPVSRVDLWSRWPVAGGAADGRSRWLRSIGVSAARRRVRDMGRPHLHQPVRRSPRAADRAARRSAGAVPAVGHAGASPRASHRVRRRARTGSSWSRTTTSACIAR